MEQMLHKEMKKIWYRDGNTLRLIEDRPMEEQLGSDLGEQILEKLPVRFIAHLTFPRKVSQALLETKWDEYVDQLSIEFGTTLGWVRADEKTEAGSRHIHALFITPHDLQLNRDGDMLNQFESIWCSVVSSRTGNRRFAAKVDPYLHSLGLRGIDYVLKGDSIEFSPDIKLYADQDTNLMTCAERRRYNRIRKEPNPSVVKKTVVPDVWKGVRGVLGGASAGVVVVHKAA